ncbi:MAG: response regulator [Chloroflexi bacterium]|nr:response regulator [Chloroflexota bacterium]
MRSALCEVAPVNNIRSIEDLAAGDDSLRFHVAILDGASAGSVSPDAIAELRQRLSRPVGLMLLVSGGARQIAAGLAAGADDCLMVPFEAEELQARVHVLRRAHSLGVAWERRGDRLESLQRLTATIAARLDEDTVIEMVLGEARRLLRSDGVALYLWDEEERVLHPAQASEGHSFAPPGDRRPGEGVVGRAFAERATICVNDYATWSDSLPNRRAAGIHAALAAPLQIREHVFGVVVARRDRSTRAYDADDERLLELLAGHTAVAINNARVYAEEQQFALSAARRAAELEAVLYGMVEGLLVVDVDGTVTSVNPAAARLFGTDIAAIVGRRLREVLEPLSERGDSAPSGATWADGLPWVRDGVCEYEVEAEIAGQERILELVSTPVAHTHGLGAIVQVRDVTDRRRSEERATQVEKLRALGQMASGVAHNVNNLLAAVMGRAELARLELERGRFDPERIAEALRLIEQAAEDGAQTVQRIQDFARESRLGQGVTIDLAEAVRDALALTRPHWRDATLAAGRPVRVEVELGRELYVAGEAAEIREVVTNLVLNAVDAMPRGGEIRIRAERTRDVVRLTVRDTGIGMTREVSSRIFEPFYTTKAELGSGLGLAIVYGTVRRCGGQIRVESAPEEGTAFTLELPAVPAPSARPGTSTTSELLEGPTRGILVVDDEPALAAILARMLRAGGHTVDTCTSGAEALERFDPARHELVMTDFGMPDLTGLDVAAAVRTQSPSTPVILVTGWAHHLAADEPPAGVVAVVAKPYRLATVLAAVGEAIAAALPAERSGSPGPAR